MKKLFATFPLLFLLLNPSFGMAEEWQPLFNGKDLTGWYATPGGQWEVSDGILRGTTAGDKGRHPFLISEKEYDNFIVRAVFLSVEGNSGLFFRATPDERGMDGFQAEIEPGPRFVGGIYESGPDARKWVAKPDEEFVKQFFKPGEWNEMFVFARDGELTVLVNGHVVSQVSDDPGAKSGHFGLQLHKGGGGKEVQFKTLEIIEDPSEEQVNHILKENTK